MTPEELQAAYTLAARPYLEAPGPVPASALGMKSWRYVFEVNSACNLKCALCHAGNRTGYEYRPGIMDMQLMEQCLDKMVYENPGAVVCCYVNSDPFLHPRIPEVIAAIKRRGLRCEFATNANYIANLDQILAQKPDLLTVSVSGSSQAVYERAHRGGNIETVKKNIIEIAEAMVRGNHHEIGRGISYHMYNYNLGDELAQMQEFANSIKWPLMLSWARAITIENLVQALRKLEKDKTGRDVPYEIGKDGMDLNTMLPPPNEEFLQHLETLRFHPKKAMKFYERFPVAPVCLIADVFTEVRWDGKVQLCAWTDDMRLTLGNYLEMSQAQISEARLNHPLCKECLRYRLNLFFHVVNCTKWDAMSDFQD
jgi:pyruvate-formate lyase-activating enzyme